MLHALSFLMNFIVESATKIKPNAPTGFIPFAFDPHYKNKDGMFHIQFIISQIQYEYTLRLNSRLIRDEKLFCFPEGQSKKIFERKWNYDEDGYSYDYNQEDGVPVEIGKIARKNIPLISSIVQLIDNDELNKVYDWFEKFMSPVSIRMESVLGMPISSFLTMHIIENFPEEKMRIIKILESADYREHSRYRIDIRKHSAEY